MARREDDMEGPDALQDAEKAVAKKAPDTWEPWMAALMSTNGQNCDWTDRKYLKPLLDALGNRAGLEKQLDSF